VNGGIRNKDCSFLLGWCFGSTGLVVGLSAEADDRQRQVNSCFVPEAVLRHAGGSMAGY
jgi:hypothetical protein